MNVDLVVGHEQEQLQPTALYELHAVLGLLHIEGGILKVSDVAREVVSDVTDE